MRFTKNQLGFAVIETFLIVVVLAIVGFTGWFVYHSKQTADKNYKGTSNTQTPPPATVKTFAECEKATGSKILTTYPEQCLTKDGKSFTNIGQSQKYLVIKEWGVKIIVNDSSLVDASYTNPKAIAGGVESVGLMTKNTTSMDFTCGGEGTGDSVTHTIGDDQDALLRAKSASDLSSASNEPQSSYVHIGSYYYVYQHNTGHGECYITDPNLAAQAKAAANAFAKAVILSE